VKILIVDDEPLVRKSLGRAFRAKGHQVVEAADGDEGLARWLEATPDLVMLDVLMPGLTGPELLKEVRKTRPGEIGRVILMSAFSGEHDLSAPHVVAEQMGADLFIPKPFDDVFALVSQAEALVGRRS
jgi:CheY-like chemotaxis protein